jgi:cytochrome c553
MDSNAAELMKRSSLLFTQKFTDDSLWQILADEFYPERADFTRIRVEGDEFVEWLYESTPAQYRRDLAGSMGAILRPRGKQWFNPRPKDEWRRTDRARAWLDMVKAKLRGVLYSNRSGFQEAMSKGDHDFVTFGNRVVSITENAERDGIFCELHHMKECAWATNMYHDVDELHRKFKSTLRRAAQKYGRNALTPQQQKTLEKDPFQEIEIRHIVMPMEDYDGYRISRSDKKRFAFASIYVGAEAQTVFKEGGYCEFPYRVARWARNNKSPYAYSPCAMTGLVDTRLLQAQVRTILDAAERSVDPPMIATRDAVLGGVNTYAGATNWIDADYDERTGEALRPLETKANIQLGIEMRQDTRNVLLSAWLLNKLNLPSDKEMTAYETSQRVAEYIRSAGPIFEPFEVDNAATLDSVMTMGLRLGWFGDLRDIPPELRGAEIDFEFDTPVQMAFDRQLVAQAQETMQWAEVNAKVKPETLDNVDFDKMFRDTQKRIGGDADWLFPMEVVMQQRQAKQQAQAQAAQAQQSAVAMQGLAHGADAVGKAADAVPKIAAAHSTIQQLMGGQGGGQPQQGQYPRDPDEMQQAA